MDEDEEVGHHPAGCTQHTTVLPRQSYKAFNARLLCNAAAPVNKQVLQQPHRHLARLRMAVLCALLRAHPEQVPAHSPATHQHTKLLQCNSTTPPAVVESPRPRRFAERPLHTPAGAGQPPVCHPHPVGHTPGPSTDAWRCAMGPDNTAYPPQEAGLCLCRRHWCTHDIEHGAATVTTEENKVKGYKHHMQQVEHCPHVSRNPAAWGTLQCKCM